MKLALYGSKNECARTDNVFSPISEDCDDTVSLKTQFEIECRCGGHSVTKKFMTILKILAAKPKLWKNLYFYKEYICNLKNYFLLAEKLENALSHH